MSDALILIVILSFAVMFCGKPDLHDALVDRVRTCKCECPR